MSKVLNVYTNAEIKIRNTVHINDFTLYELEPLNDDESLMRWAYKYLENTVGIFQNDNYFYYEIYNNRYRIKRSMGYSDNSYKLGDITKLSYIDIINQKNKDTKIIDLHTYKNDFGNCIFFMYKNKDKVEEQKLNRIKLTIDQAEELQILFEETRNMFAEDSYKEGIDIMSIMYGKIDEKLLKTKSNNSIYVYFTYEELEWSLPMLDHHSCEENLSEFMNPIDFYKDEVYRTNIRRIKENFEKIIKNREKFVSPILQIV